MPKAKTWEEYKAECEAIAKEGITVLGFVEPWVGWQTKLICNCEKHGEWGTTNISDFKQGKSCPKCGYQAAAEFLKAKNLKDDSIHIEHFMKTGAFKEGTKFWRSDRKTKAGATAYWNYTCPVCSNDEYVKAGVCTGVFESSTSGLKKGESACRCSQSYRYTKEQWEYRLKKQCKKRGYKFIGWSNEKFGSMFKFKYFCKAHGIQEMTALYFLKGQGCAHCAGFNQKQAYINLVQDSDIDVCLKFGIAIDSAERLKGQNRNNKMQMKNLIVYEFPDSLSCKRAESEIKARFKCRYLKKRDLTDGHTETLPLNMFDDIVKVYEEFGGVKV